MDVCEGKWVKQDIAKEEHCLCKCKNVIVPDTHPTSEQWSQADDTGIGARGIREQHLSLGYVIGPRVRWGNKDKQRARFLERARRIEAQYALRMPKLAKRVTAFSRTGENAQVRAMRWKTYCLPIPRYAIRRSIH